MKKIRFILLIIVFTLVAAILFMKFTAWQGHQQQVDLAKVLRKAISSTMLDLSQAKSASIEGVPADGQWYHAVKFNTHQYGQIEYTVVKGELMRQDEKLQQVIARHVEEFNLRRLSQDPMIIEVNVALKKGKVINSNFRVRLQE